MKRLVQHEWGERTAQRNRGRGRAREREGGKTKQWREGKGWENVSESWGERDVYKNAGSSCSSCYGISYALALYDGLVRECGLFLRCKIKQPQKPTLQKINGRGILVYTRLERHKVNNSGAESTSIEFFDLNAFKIQQIYGSLWPTLVLC